MSSWPAQVVITKEEVGWELNELEEAARLVAMEDGSGDNTLPQEDSWAGTLPEEGGAGTLPEEGEAGTLPEEGGAVALPEGSGAVSRPQEGRAPEEGVAVTLSEEEGRAFTHPEDRGGADVHPEERGCDVATVTRGVFVSLLYGGTARPPTAELHSNRPESPNGCPLQSLSNDSYDRLFPHVVEDGCSAGDHHPPLSDTSKSNATCSECDGTGGRGRVWP